MDRLSKQVQALRIDHANSRRSPLRAVTPWLLLLAVVVGAAVVGVGWNGSHRADGQAAVPLRADPAVAEPESDTPIVLMAGGKIASDHIVVLATKVSGQVIELRVEQGDRVERRDVLARLEDIEYRAQHEMRLALLREVEAAQEKARYDFDHTTKLRDQQNASQTEWVGAKSSLDQGAARVAAARAAVELAAKQLRDCQVVAPMAGTILERFIDVGDYVAAEGGRSGLANGRIVEIADTDHLRVEVDVAERDIARLHGSMKCEIFPEAYPERRYEGHVLWIDPMANYGKGTVGVKIRIHDPDEHTRIGGSARVNFLPEP